MIDITTGTYTVERYGPGKWLDTGKYERGILESFQMEASIQPATGNMIKILPEHRRSAETNVVYTESRLFISDEKNQKASDVVIYDGKRFEVMNVKKWADITDIPHYECLIVKEDGQGNDL